MGSKIKKADLDAMIREAMGPELAALRAELNRPVTRNAAGIVEGTTPQPDTTRSDTRDGDEKTERRLGLVRCAKALRLAGGDPERAVKILKQQGYERAAAKFERALTGMSIGDGSVFMPPEYSSEFIELLRNRTVVRKAGAREVPLSGTLEIGRQNGGATATWGEPDSTTRASQPSTGTVKLVERTLTVIVPAKNSLILKADRSAEQFIQDDLIACAAVESDAKHLRGTGSASAPKGIRYLANPANTFAATSGKSVATATADLTKAIRLVAESNIPMDVKTDFAWFLNARVFWWLAGLRDGNNNLVFKPELDEGRLFGFPVWQTQQIPGNLGAGGTDSEVIFAAMSQVIVGNSEAVRVEAIANGTYVDADGKMVSGVSNDETVFRLVLGTDCALRHDQAAAVIHTVDWGT